MQTFKRNGLAFHLVMSVFIILLVMISCSETEIKTGSLALIPAQVSGRSILPNTSARSVTAIQITGTGPLGAVLQPQDFLYGGRIAIDGLTPGSWTIVVTGYNGTDADLGVQLTAPSSQTVTIASGSTTTAVFSLQYLTVGDGSASVQVSWPSANSSIVSVTGVLGAASAPEATVTAPASSSSASLSFPSPIGVGSYPLDLVLTNASGTTINLPMIETVNIFSELESSGSINLVSEDVVFARTPVITAESSVDDSNQQSISITSSTPSASLRYQVFDAEPTEAFSWTDSTVYGGPFLLSASGTTSPTTKYIRAIAYKNGYQDSLPVIQTVILGGSGEGSVEIIRPSLIANISILRTDANIVRPSFAVTYSIQGSLTLDSVRWYVDGVEQTDADTDGDCNTFTYGGTLSTGQHQVLVQLTYHNGTEPQRSVSGTLRFSVSGVVETPSLTTTNTIGGRQITLDCSTLGASIHYTLDETTPTSASQLYVGPFPISTTTVLKAIAVKEGATDSPVFTSEPIVVERVPTPTFTEDAESHTVQIICADATSVYYTLDGTPPDLTSIFYDTPLSFDQTATIKAIGVASGKATSLVGTTTHTVSYSLGETGPGGGIIFLVNADAARDGWTYLEAAPEETGSYAWTPSSVIIGDTHTEMGTGESNTLSITSKSAEGAAKICKDKVFGGYEDWFLPSRDELLAMFDLTDGVYWSSSEASTTAAWAFDLTEVVPSQSVVKTQLCKVRAVRAFL